MEKQSDVFVAGDHQTGTVPQDRRSVAMIVVIGVILLGIASAMDDEAIEEAGSVTCLFILMPITLPPDLLSDGQRVRSRHGIHHCDS